MTQFLESLRTAPLHVRRGGSRQRLPIMARYDDGRVISTYDPKRCSVGTATYLGRIRLACEGITISEVVLEDHAQDLTAVFRAASKLFLDVEFTSGPRITEPVVRISGEDTTQASYYIPDGWDLTDALQRLPDAHAAARPEVARALRHIEKEKKTSSEEVRRLLDHVTLAILKAGEPYGVFEDLEHMLLQAGKEERASLSSPAGTI